SDSRKTSSRSSTRRFFNIQPCTIPDGKPETLWLPAQPLAVLALVVLAELAALDLAPPPLILDIPFNRRLKRLLEAERMLPAEAAQLGIVKRIAAVVAGPVLNLADERLGLAEDGEHLPHHVDVVALVLPADVVSLAGLALEQHRLDTGAVVLHIQPVAHLAAIPIERQRLVVQRVGDKERQQLLRVLVRPEGVAAPRNDGVQPIRHVVGTG